MSPFESQPAAGTSGGRFEEVRMLPRVRQRLTAESLILLATVALAVALAALAALQSWVLWRDGQPRQAAAFLLADMLLAAGIAGGAWRLREAQGPLPDVDTMLRQLVSEERGGPVASIELADLGRFAPALRVLHSRLQLTVRMAEARAAIASELNQPQPLALAVQAVCRHLRSALDCDAVLVLVRESDLADAFAVTDGTTQGAPVHALLDGDGPIGVAARAQGPLYLGVAPGTVEAACGLTDVCAAPMRIGERVLGVVAVNRAEQVRGEEAGLVDVAAQQLTLALERYGFLALMQHRATTDELTGLYNYRFLVDHLDQQVALAARLQTPLSVLLLDLDHFKDLNDTHGHHAGDIALATFASVLKQSVRRADLAARYGGEEFVVVMTSTGREDARRVAEKIREVVAATRVPLEGGADLRISVSIGCATHPFDADTPSALLELADAALYRAKAAGRNQVRIADDVHLVATPRPIRALAGRRARRVGDYRPPV